MNAFAQPSAAPVQGPQLDNRRVLAALIDLVLLFAGGFLLGMIIALVSGGDATWGPQMNVIALAWSLYYYFALESGDGQTVGKKLLKLRVVRTDGSPVGMREVAVRTILRIIDGLFLYLVGLIVMLVTGERRQRLGDLAAGTKVVDAASSFAPQVSEATAAAPAAVGAEGLEHPEAVGPVEHTPVDVGTPLEGFTPPPAPAAPELSDFEPFAEPAPAAAEEEPYEAGPEPDQGGEPEPSYEQPEESYEPFAAGEPVAADQPKTGDEPFLAGPGIEPNVQPAPTEEPYLAGPGIEPNVTPAAPHEPAVEQDEPAVEHTSGTSADLSPQPEEPRVEAASQWPNMYAARAEEAREEEAAEAPADEPVAEEPQVEVAPPAEEPVEDLRADAVRATDEPAGPEVPGLTGSPEPDQPSPQPDQPSDEPEEQINVKSVETVSAIDLVMGADEPQQQPESSEDDDGSDQPAAS